MLVIPLLAGCGQHGSAQAPSPSASSTTPAPPISGAGSNRCATAQLQFSLGPANAATGNYIATVSVVNRSGPACYLGGYPGVELLDAGGHHLQDATRSTDSFFGTYRPSHRVDFPPGGSSSFDLTWGGNDPCGGTPAQQGASMKVTPPGAYDSATIVAHLTVCPNSLTVHPLGSRPQQG